MTPVEIVSFPPNTELVEEFRRLVPHLRATFPVTVSLLSEAVERLPDGYALVVAFGDVAVPACLASVRVSGRERLTWAATWVRDTLAGDGRSPYWAKRLALARLDLDRNRASCLALLDESGAVAGVATAIGPNRLIGPGAAGARILLDSGPVPVEATGTTGNYVLYQSPVTLSWVPCGRLPDDAAVAALTVDSEGQPTLAAGWLLDGFQHSLDLALPGTPVFSLSSGNLIGIDRTPIEVLTALPAEGALELNFEEALESSVDNYLDRRGYESSFLGVDVPLPKTRLTVQLLPYTNFSVGHLPSRRMALYTAVNISGEDLVKQTRSGDPWRLDPRLPRNQQLGASFYQGTPLDRGHLVRRLDPVWGTAASLAELDTFHYPNSTPQHRDLNRKTWNDLEDYVYANAGRHDLRVTVFTGPVLRLDDPPFHGAQLPEEFWKVVVIRRIDNRRLSATAYLLSQGSMIAGLEFSFGAFRTYQVSVRDIEARTGLDFGVLRNYDPKGRSAGLESMVTPAPIEKPDDIDLGLGSGVIASPTVLREELVAALQSFDWKLARQLTGELVECIERHPDEFDVTAAGVLLGELRNKRRFRDLVWLAETFLHKGIESPQILRQYAQALIDQGVYRAAGEVLRTLPEDKEARGLLGRIQKQIYINGKSLSNGRRLQEAIQGYWSVYQDDPEEVWHGINAVALAMRAQRDGIGFAEREDPRKTARRILATLDQRLAEQGVLVYWDEATAMEAHLALGEHAAAIGRAKAYAEHAGAFALASTLRQLEEVWLLSEREVPGNALLPLLRAHLLQAEGGGLQLTAGSAEFRLEKVFGLDRSVTLKWYEQGLLSARSIARIELNGAGLGTGWLADPAELMGRPGPPLLITNAHVIGPDGADRYPGARRIDEVGINFEIQQFRTRAVKVIAHSPVHQLDCTVVELEQAPPDTGPLPLDPRPLTVQATPQRLYVIGHPGGRSLEFSLQDNYLIAARDRFVHYRTPTEGGSSGSPVFGPVGWKVVALHHAGRKDMPRIDGEPGIYEANEGIAIGEIRRFLSAGSSTP